MTELTITDGNLYLTDGSVSGSTITYTGTQLVVCIHSSKIDYNFDNQLQIIPIPNSRGNRSNTPFSRVVDLKRITEALQVQGFLEDEESESATTKRNNLLTLAKNRNELTAVWNTGSYQTVWKPASPTANDRGVFINKMMFSETAGKIGDADVTGDPTPERQIALQIQLIRGKDI